MTTPKAVVLGTLHPGEIRRCCVEVWDDRKLGGCQVSRVVSTNSRFVVAAFVPADAGYEPKNSGKHLLGRCVGRVELTINAPDSPSLVSENVSLFVVGSEPAILTIPITGSVLPRFELQPPDVKLPRVSASGPLYSACVICRNTSGGRLMITPATVPQDLIVRVKRGEDIDTVKVMTIEVSPGAGRTGPQSTRQVILTVSDGEITETLTLDVTVGPAD